MQGLTPVGAAFVGVLKQPWAITAAANTRLTALRDRVSAAGPEMSALAGTLLGAFLMIDGLIGLT